MYIYTSSMSCVYWRNNLKGTIPLTTFVESKYTFADQVQPHTPKVMRQRIPEMEFTRAPQLFT